MKAYTEHIVASCGDDITFEGNFSQWEDCFFTLPGDIEPAMGQIFGFCESMKWTVTISFKVVE